MRNLILSFYNSTLSLYLERHQISPLLYSEFCEDEKVSRMLSKNAGHCHPERLSFLGLANFRSDASNMFSPSIHNIAMKKKEEKRCVHITGSRDILCSHAIISKYPIFLGQSLWYGGFVVNNRTYFPIYFIYLEY